MTATEVSVSAREVTDRQSARPGCSLADKLHTAQALGAAAGDGGYRAVVRLHCAREPLPA